MNRDYWLRKIGTFIGRIEAGESPVPIRDIHVFGSFARGAPVPNDLDLIVVHDPPSPDIMEPLMKAVEGYSYDWLYQRMNAERRFGASVRKVFRRGSERMDINLGESLDAVLTQLVDIPRDEIIPIWTHEDRDWRSKVSAIPLNPSAKSHPRDHFIEIKRAGCSLDEMNKAMEALNTGVLSLKKIPFENSLPPLNRAYQRCCDHWTRIGAMGADSLKALPWALWWLQSRRSETPHLDKFTGIWNPTKRHRVEVGRLYPVYVLSLFHDIPRLKTQCLIPHLRVRGPNLLYVFERGPNWPKPETEGPKKL